MIRADLPRPLGQVVPIIMPELKNAKQHILKH